MIGALLCASHPASIAADQRVQQSVVAKNRRGEQEQDAAGKNGIGPSLFGVVGRPAGTAPGFSYSTAMKGAGTWTPAKLGKDTGAITPADLANSAHLDIEACRALIPAGVFADGILLVSMRGPFGVGSGKSGTPCARMHAEYFSSLLTRVSCC